MSQSSKILLGIAALAAVGGAVYYFKVMKKPGVTAVVTVNTTKPQQSIEGRLVDDAVGTASHYITSLWGH